MENFPGDGMVRHYLQSHDGLDKFGLINTAVIVNIPILEQLSDKLRQLPCFNMFRFTQSQLALVREDPLLLRFALQV